MKLSFEPSIYLKQKTNKTFGKDLGVKTALTSSPYWKETRTCNNHNYVIWFHWSSKLDDVFNYTKMILPRTAEDWRQKILLKVLIILTNVSESMALNDCFSHIAVKKDKNTRQTYSTMTTLCSWSLGNELQPEEGRTCSF